MKCTTFAWSVLTAVYTCVLPVRLAGQARSKTGLVTAFIDVSVIPMDRDRRLEHQTVIVRDDRIVKIGPVGRVSVPREAIRIESGGTEEMRDAMRQLVSTVSADSVSSRQRAEAIASNIAAYATVVKTLHQAGVGLLSGTDAHTGVLLPGFALHRELEAYVAAGLTPYEALETSTRNVAEFLGTLDSTGTVAAGKRADLVLLDGDPRVDIRNLARPAGVMAAGRWISRDELDRKMRVLEGRWH